MSGNSSYDLQGHRSFKDTGVDTSAGAGDAPGLVVVVGVESAGGVGLGWRGRAGGRRRGAVCGHGNSSESEELDEEHGAGYLGDEGMRRRTLRSLAYVVLVDKAWLLVVVITVYTV